MPENAARLKVTLAYIDPAPWRQIEVPLSMTFSDLHDVIQAAFLWDDCHLWDFRYGDVLYGPSLDGDPFEDELFKNASKVSLTKLQEVDARKSFWYTYDMGDNWKHKIAVQKLFEAPEGVVLPRFLKGQWRRPPEDIGGPPGYEYFLEVIADPEHEDYEHYSYMLEDGAYGTEDINESAIIKAMKRLAGKRVR